MRPCWRALQKPKLKMPRASNLATIKDIPDNYIASLPVAAVLPAVTVARVVDPAAEVILPDPVPDLIDPAAPVARVDPVQDVVQVGPAVMVVVAAVDMDPAAVAVAIDQAVQVEALQVRIAVEASVLNAHHVPVAHPVVPLKDLRISMPCGRNKLAWSAECVRIGTSKKTKHVNRNAPLAEQALHPRAEAAVIAARAGIRSNRNCWRRATTSPR